MREFPDDFDEHVDKPKPAHSIGLRMVRVIEVAARPVQWLWLGRLALGKLTLLGGSPNAGKTTIECDMAARLSKGIPWPDGSGSPTPGSVVMLSAEDAIDDTLRPRLEAVGADLRRVHVIKSVVEANGKNRSFDLQQDLLQLRGAIAQIGDVQLVSFDPITAYMGGDIDSHRTTDVRAVLEPVANFADEVRVAILGITHPPKAAQSNAINSFTGSLAYIAAARLGFIAIEEPETERRLLLAVKNNLGPLPAGLGYSIEACELPSGIVTSRIAWDGRPVTITATEALQAANATAKRDKLKDAIAFLEEQLANGPVPVTELFRVAEEWEIAEKTLRRAGYKLCVTKEKTGFQGAWTWALPQEEAQ